jgi:hypothetical protein
VKKMVSVTQTRERSKDSLRARTPAPPSLLLSFPTLSRPYSKPLRKALQMGAQVEMGV